MEMSNNKQNDINKLINKFQALLKQSKMFVLFSPQSLMFLFYN